MLENTYLKKGVLVALITLVLDQIHKSIMIYWVKMPNFFMDGLPVLQGGGQVIEVTSFFNLVMVWNYGISFGMFSDSENSKALMLSILALAIVGFLLYLLRKAENAYTAWSIGLIIGGAIGNVIDRAVYGAVADFFDFHIAGYHWPAFNIADSTIFIGVFLLVTESFFNINKSDEKI